MVSGVSGKEEIRPNLRMKTGLKCNGLSSSMISSPDGIIVAMARTAKMQA